MTDNIPSMADKKNLTIRLDDALREQVDQVAIDERRSVSSAVAVLLEEALAARRTPRTTDDEMRRLLWILANRNGGTISIGIGDFITVPRLPGITITADRISGTTEIRADQ
jgi:hypothetical protein